MFWKGKPQRSPWELLHNCCGLAPTGDIKISTSSDAGMELRGGAMIDLLTFKEAPDNAASWKAFASQFATGPSTNTSARYCYCSVVNQCRQVSAGSDHALPMNPPEVAYCPKTSGGYQIFPPST